VVWYDIIYYCIITSIFTPFALERDAAVENADYSSNNIKAIAE